MKRFAFSFTSLIVVSLLFFLSTTSSAQKEKENGLVNTSVTTEAPKLLSATLPIPARRQWDENKGYCVETCIQSFALYYGTYISQYQVRALIDPEQKQQVLIGKNEDVVLDKLHLSYETWEYDDHPLPQHKSHLAWIKQQLSEGHPVIGTVYMQGENDPDYDHAVSVIGFQSLHDATGYHDGDQLIFFDNDVPDPFNRPFNTLPAARSQVSGGSYEYYLPEGFDYGCSLTGVVDPKHETVPVELSIDRWDEPNLVAGQKPVTLHGTLTVKSLVPGKSYSLLRYDDHQKVPDAKFIARGGYKWRHSFAATDSTQTFNDDFTSDACVIYRCIAE